MDIWNNNANPATNPPGGWFYDKPLPCSPTAKGEAVLDTPEAGADSR